MGRLNVTAAASGAGAGGLPVPQWLFQPILINAVEGQFYSEDLAVALNTTLGVIITVTQASLPAGLAIVGLKVEGTPTEALLVPNLKFTATNGSGSDESIETPLQVEPSVGIPAGDITATDPLGLSVGQDIAWTIDDGDPPPPSGPGKRSNPGHYLHVAGQPAPDEQGLVDFYVSLHNQIDNSMSDIPELIGAHIGIPWGAVNTTGDVHDFTEMDSFRDQVLAAGGRKIIYQLQYKVYHQSAPRWEVPLDLAADVHISRAGYTAGVWRDHVWPRYVATLIEFAHRYNDDPSVELVICTESAPSFDSTVPTPGDYNVDKMQAALYNIWANASAEYTSLQFGANINALGGRLADNRIPEMMEEVYRLRLFQGGPDVAETPAWLNFEGISTDPSSPPAVRDYRGEMGALYTFSSPVMDQSGKTPAQLIDDMQNHKSTHYSWIAGGRTYSWDDMKAAIQADPTVHTACPLRYLDGCK